MVSCSDSTDGWGSLPLDLAFLILDNISEFIDLVRFWMVCKEWGRVAKVYAPSTKLCKKFPMLVIPKRNRKEGGRKHKGVLHRFSQEQEKFDNHFQCIHFPKTKIDGSRRYCFGCGYGWLAMIDVVPLGSRKDDDDEYESIITLFNPFTNTELPSLPPLRKNTSRLKVILSDDPSLNPNDYMAVAIYMYRWNELNFIKAGQNWQHITINLGFEIQLTDAIFYKGQVYAASIYGTIVSFDFNGKQQVHSLTLEARIAFRRPPFAEYITPEQVYLAKSTNGDLLFVQRYVALGQRTASFKVFKLLFNGFTVAHAEVNDIGDEALFVGDNQTESVVASNIRGCQPNCIYFTDGYTRFDLYGDLQTENYRVDKECDMGVFNLEDGTIKQYDPTYSFSCTTPPPFWIIPHFKL